MKKILLVIAILLTNLTVVSQIRSTRISAPIESTVSDSILAFNGRRARHVPLSVLAERLRELGIQVEKTSDLTNDGEDGFSPFVTLSDIYRSNTVVVGGYSHQIDYTYYVQASVYIINSIVYDHERIFDNLTCSPSHPTLDRVDVIVINDDKTFSIVPGTPATNPLKPEIDLLTQVELTFILVKANTTVSPDIVTELVYNENTGEPTEWDYVSSSASVDVNSTTNPFIGTKNIEFHNSPISSIAIYSPETPIAIDASKSIVLNILITQALPKNRISLYLSNGTEESNIPLSLTPAGGGLDYNNTSSWQTVTIPLEGTWALLLEDLSELGVASYSTNGNFRVDNIRLQEGLNSVGGDTQITATSQIVNNGATGASTYVEHRELSSVAITNDYNDLDNIPTPSSIFDYVEFTDTGLSSPTEGKLEYDNISKFLTTYKEESYISQKLGQDLWVRVYNNTGTTIPAGKVISITGVGASKELYVELATSTIRAHASNVVGFTLHSIEPARFGYGGNTGFIDSVDTSHLTAGLPVYMSNVTPGEVIQTPPNSPDYKVKMGGCVVSDASEGQLIVDINNQGNKQDLNKILNGTILEPHTVEVDSDGTDITLTLHNANAGHHLSLIFDQEFVPIADSSTIILPEGTDKDPIRSFVYIPKSTGVLTTGSSFPSSEEFIAVADVIAPSAARSQTHGLYKVHAWTDHLSNSMGQGHISGINKWIRNQPATWFNGSVVAFDTAYDTSVASINISYTLGSILQLHEHTTPNWDTAAGDVIDVINHSVAEHTLITSLNSVDLDKDSQGNDFGNGYWVGVVWGVGSETAKDSHLFLNLPNGGYTKLADALIDNKKTADTSIPKEYTGTGFLLTKIVFKKTGSNISIASDGVIDLRPKNTGGGGSSITPGITTIVGLTDTPADMVGAYGKVLTPNVGETDMVWTDVVNPSDLDERYPVTASNHFSAQVSSDNLGWIIHTTVPLGSYVLMELKFRNGPNSPSIMYVGAFWQMGVDDDLISSATGYGSGGVNRDITFFVAEGETTLSVWVPLTSDHSTLVATMDGGFDGLDKQITSIEDVITGMPSARLQIDCDVSWYGVLQDEVVTTNTDQTNLSGDKSWTGDHDFSDSDGTHENTLKLNSWGARTTYNTLATSEMNYSLLSAAGLSFIIRDSAGDYFNNSIFSNYNPKKADVTTWLPRNGGVLAVETILATVGESVTANDLLYLKSDGKYWKVDATDEDKSIGKLVIASVSRAADTEILMSTSGEIITTGLTTNARYYISETSGEITNDISTFASGSIVRFIGYALSTTVLDFQPSTNYIKLL